MQEEKYDVFKPTSYDDYIGQSEAKSLVRVMVEAANKEMRYFPSMLFNGSAGLGKTTLAQIVLKGINYTFIDGNSVNTSYKDIITQYVIIDEIHNVKSDICDSLNILLDKQEMVIMGCTTNPGMLPSPFRSRFRSINLLPYTLDNLVEIMERVLERKNAPEIDYRLLMEIARRGRRTPRKVLQYLSFILDFMSVYDMEYLDEDTLYEAFDMLGVDERGLLPIDHRYLDALPDNGKPVGLQYLSAVTYTDKETIEQEIEPYLLELKIIDRTPKGRVLLGV